jgi:hypothetical protein
MVAMTVLAAAVAAFAYASPSKHSVVSLPRLEPTTRIVRIDGRQTLLVINLEVAHVPNGVRVHVSCGACRRLGGAFHLRSSRGTSLFSDVNWLLAPGRSIRVSLTKRGAVGRILLLVADRTRRRLVLHAAGCLSDAGRSVTCPAGVKNPSPGTPASAVSPGAATPTPQNPTTTTAPGASTPSTPSAPGNVTFSAGFEGGAATPLTPQCAPNTPSTPPRFRGTYTLERSIVGQGSSAIESTLPKDPNPTTYPLEACDLMTPLAPIGLGTDSYLGLMVYVPVGWTIPGGVDIYELHFQNVYGAPIILNLNPNHVTIQLETGACNNYTTPRPGCANRSNADLSSGQTMPGYYAIPPGKLVLGAWNEIVLHVGWSSSSSGQIQSYYRTEGGPSGWTQSSAISGIPTVQWDITKGCCYTNYVDEVEAYTFASNTPLSVWFDNIVDGTGLGSVEATMPN